MQGNKDCLVTFIGYIMCLRNYSTKVNSLNCSSINRQQACHACLVHTLSSILFTFKIIVPVMHHSKLMVDIDWSVTWFASGS